MHRLVVSIRQGQVIDDVSFDVRDGESIGVIGPNGGGKSTLLKLILGLESPETGTLEVLGEAAGKGRQKIGYVPQAMRFDPLYPISVIEIVLMGRMDRLKFGAYSKKSVDLSLRMHLKRCI